MQAEHHVAVKVAKELDRPHILGATLFLFAAFASPVPPCIVIWLKSWYCEVFLGQDCTHVKKIFHRIISGLYQNALYFSVFLAEKFNHPRVLTAGGSSSDGVPGRPPPGPGPAALLGLHCSLNMYSYWPDTFSLLPEYVLAGHIVCMFKTQTSRTFISLNSESRPQPQRGRAEGHKGVALACCWLKQTNPI